MTEMRSDLEEWKRHEQRRREHPLRLAARSEEVDRLAGRAVGAARERARLSPPELAVALGIDPSELELVENGSRPLRLAELVATAAVLSTSVAELVGGIECAQYERLPGERWRPEPFDAAGGLRKAGSSDILVAFGCALRRRRRWTRPLHRVAWDAGVSDDTIRRIERGMARNVTVSTLVRVADACGTTLAELFEASTDLLAGLVVERLLQPAGMCVPTDVDSAFSADRLAAMLRAIPSRLAAVVVDIPEEDLRRTPSADEWSAVEVIGHLADKLDCWRQRVLRIVGEERRPDLEPFDQEEAVRVAGYARMDLFVLLASVTEEATRFASLVATLDEDLLRRRGHHPEYGSVTVRQCVTLPVASVADHLAQITRATSCETAPETRPMRRQRTFPGGTRGKT